MRSFFIVFGLIFCLINGLFAQNLRFNRLYQTADGMATGYCKDVVQDSVGFVWIATDDGLSRFDGAKFINYKKEIFGDRYFKSFFKKKDGTLLAICDYEIIKILSYADTVWFESFLPSSENLLDNSLHFPKSCFEDQKGNFWIMEKLHIVRILPNGKIKRYLFDDKHRSDNYHRSFRFCEDQFGNLWASSQRGYLFVYDPKNDVFKEVLLPEKLNIINDLHFFDQKIWVAGNGIHHYTVNAHHQIVKTEQIIGKEYLVNCMLPTLDSAWFVGLLATEKGIQLLDKSKKMQALYQSPESAKNITGVQHIYASKDGNLWIAHDNGLAFFRKNLFNSLSNGLPLNSAIAIAQSQQDYYSSHDQVYKISAKNNNWTAEEVLDAYRGKAALALTQYQDQMAVANIVGNIFLIKANKRTKEFDFSNRGGAIFSLYADQNKNLWACQAPDKIPTMGLIKIDSNQKITFYEKDKGLINRVLSIRSSAKGDIYAFGQGNDAYVYKYNPDKDFFINISLPFKDSIKGSIAINDAIVFEQKIWLATSHGFFCYDISKKQIDFIDLGKDFNESPIRAVASTDGKVFWLAHHSYGLIRYENGKIVSFDEKSGLLSKNINYRALFIDKKGFLWAGTTQGVAVSQQANMQPQITPAPRLLKLLINNEKFAWNTKRKVFDHNTFFKVYFTSFSFPADQIRYQYRLLGMGKDTVWNDLDQETDFTSPPLDEGKYTFQVRALQGGGYVWSEPTSWKMEVELPWYRRPSAYFFYMILLAFIVWALVKINTRRLELNNKRLQKIIKERTSEVIQQKTEIELQRDSILKQNSELYLQKEEILVQNEELFQQKEEIVAQRDFIESQNHQLSEKNTQIQDSIRAAQSIQQAILPNSKRLESLLGNYFILFRPKDIVSGDFYWCGQVQQQTILAVADCTGHGVSGALVTMIGNMLLDRIIHFKNITEPADILTELNIEILKAFTEDDTRKANGMDIAIISMEKQENLPTEIIFAGAKRPLFYFKQKEQSLHELKGDRKSIDGNRNEKKVFHNQTIFLEKDDSIYLCTDGFADQNNVLRQKLGHDAFLQLLKENAVLETYQQKSNLETYLVSFQGGMEQRDDILLVGVKI